MNDVWNAALDSLSDKVSEHLMETWFRELRFNEIEEGRCILSIEDDFKRVWIEDNYLDLLSQVVGEVVESEVTVAIEPAVASEAGDAVVSLDVTEERRAARDGRALQPVEFVAPEPVDVAARAEACGMNPRYTFDEFVVGPSNQFVYAASAAVAQKPAETYNPLFIFGGVGLGKTHLLQAIGNETLRRDPTARVAYLSSEEFMNELITSLRQKEMNKFRSRYRNSCDLLLIDDIQFIGGKDSTQEEFFHTFNALYQSGKQIVMTSDKSPKDLPGIEERLASRFSWGLIADIQAPEIETRIAILEKKAEADGIDLDPDVALMIARSVRSNVRELEGALIHLGAQASLTGRPITAEFAQGMLERMNLDHGRKLTPALIIETVAHHFDITSADICGNRRPRNISQPRQIAMYLARKHTGQSFPELGREFGGKDHTTVLAAFRKFEGLVAEATDPLVREVDALERELLR